jgi:hypothetical protein
MRGWVYCLQLLLALSSTVILGSRPRETDAHILLSQVQDSPTLRARSPYLYPPGKECPSYTPRHWVPFCHLLRLAGLWWRYLNPPPYGVQTLYMLVPIIQPQDRPNRTHFFLQLQYCLLMQPPGRTAQKTPLLTVLLQLCENCC